MGLGFAIGLNVRHQLPKSPESQIEKAPSPSPAATLHAPPGDQSPTTTPIAPLERLRVLTSSADAARRFDLPAAILLVDQLDLGECKSARFLLKNLNRNHREILLDAIADRWANLDPVDAFNNAQETRYDNDWSNRIGYAAGAALIKKDSEAALERISFARNDDLREKAAEWVLPELASTKGRRAAEYLSSNSRLTRFEHLYRIVAKEFGRTSPQEAFAWARSLTDSRHRKQSIEGVWLGWAEADPTAAASAMEGDSFAKLPAGVVSAVARNWSRSDIKATLKWIGSIPDLGERDEAYNSIEFDPGLVSRGDALQLLLSIESDSARNQIAESMGVHLAREDIQTALSWAESLPSDKGRDNALSSVVQYWTSSDPSAAARYIKSQTDWKERSTELSRAVSGWSQLDPDAATTFVKTLPAGRDREIATGGVIESLSRDESKKALELFQTLTDPEVIARLAPNIIGSLIKFDHVTALRVASQIPEESQPEAFGRLVRAWAPEQPQLAGEWINALSPGNARDSAIKAYVSAIDGIDAGLATKWANQIQDPIERMNVVFGSFSRWLQSDKNAARNWVETVAIPEGFRPYFDRMLNDEKWAQKFR